MLSERGPNAFQFPGPRGLVFVRGVKVGGGEPKDLRFSCKGRLSTSERVQIHVHIDRHLFQPHTIE